MNECVNWDVFVHGGGTDFSSLKACHEDLAFLQQGAKLRPPALLAVAVELDEGSSSG